MKRISTAIAAALIASGATAAEIYNGFGHNNPDLYSGYAADGVSAIAIRPGVGDSFDRYHGWSRNNPDIYNISDAPRSQPSSGYKSPDRYGGFDDGNPDLM